MHRPRYCLRGRLPLDLGSLATGSFLETDLVKRRWPIGEELKGTRSGHLAINIAAINTVIRRRCHKNKA